MRLTISLICMYVACLVAYQFGQYAMMYSTVSNDIYMVAYAEETNPEQRLIMHVAAWSRCRGILQEDFSCKTGNENMLQRGAA